MMFYKEKMKALIIQLFLGYHRNVPPPPLERKSEYLKYSRASFMILLSMKFNNGCKIETEMFLHYLHTYFLLNTFQKYKNI